MNYLVNRVAKVASSSWEDVTSFPANNTIVYRGLRDLKGITLTLSIETFREVDGLLVKSSRGDLSYLVIKVQHRPYGLQGITAQLLRDIQREFVPKVLECFWTAPDTTEAYICAALDETAINPYHVVNNY